MEVLETAVRLVVKAPNQQIGDQVIDCKLGWTVQKLKTHLSEFYPNKPRTEEQRLIYSGQLLHDHLMLKDFLRQYDTEKVHTVHLVCLPTPETFAASAKPTSNQRINSSGMARSEIGHHSTTTATSNPTFADELRHRFTNTPSHLTNQYAFLDPGLNAMTPPVAPMMTNFVYPPMMPDQMAQQMAWMQQVYGHYVHSYFQQLHGTTPIPVGPSTSPMPTQAASSPMSLAQDGVGVPPNQTPPPVAVPAPAVPDAAPAVANNRNENIRMNAQGGLVDDDDEDDRAANGGRWDWLDWAYVLSRVTILFSIVYFYSSLSRFFMVIVIAILMYLYQMGWLNAARPRHRIGVQLVAEAPEQPQQPDLVNDNNAVAGAAAAVPEAMAEDDVVDNAEVEQMERETREIVELMNRGMDNPQAGDRATAFGLWIWTLVSTFFTSLLPETPARGNFN